MQEKVRFMIFFARWQSEKAMEKIKVDNVYAKPAKSLPRRFKSEIEQI